VTSANDSAPTGAVPMHNADATPPADPSPPPLPLPTDLITDVLPPSPPSPAASTGPDPTTQASTIVSSPGPRDVQQAPAAVHTRAGGRAVEKVSPPGPKTQLRELADPQTDTTTGTVTVTVVPGWTPMKVILAGNVAAVVFLAIIAMLLLSRRGRPSVSHNSAPVILGENNQLVEPPAGPDGGTRPGKGIHPGTYAEGLVDGAAMRAIEEPPGGQIGGPNLRSVR